jgi:hypothetical protein
MHPPQLSTHFHLYANLTKNKAASVKVWDGVKNKHAWVGLNEEIK